MKKVSKKFIVSAAISAALSLSAVVTSMAYFPSYYTVIDDYEVISSNYRQSDKDKAAEIQRRELEKYNRGNRKCEQIKLKIKANESKIRALEMDYRSQLDSELASLLQIEEDLNLQLSQCPWYSDRYIFLNGKIENTKSKMRVVKSKIEKNNREIESLKRVREKLDGEYAVALQIQEAQGAYSY